MAGLLAHAADSPNPDDFLFYLIVENKWEETLASLEAALPSSLHRYLDYRGPGTRDLLMWAGYERASPQVYIALLSAVLSTKDASYLGNMSSDGWGTCLHCAAEFHTNPDVVAALACLWPRNLIAMNPGTGKTPLQRAKDRSQKVSKVEVVTVLTQAADGAGSTFDAFYKVRGARKEPEQKES